MKIASCDLAGRSGHEAGRALLAELYRGETGRALPPIALGARGKPYFPGEDWYFSISHTRRHAFCALSRREIGIDAEELDRRVDLRLAEKILSPGEKAQFDTAPDKRRALLTFWVLKEAQAKKTGAGLAGYPADTAFSLDDPRVMEMDGCLVAVIE
ncbi:MAG: 4'-phosphopantetheinyl transferase superfamily protein [Firmicutes bacterium]|nr:4'-phosphopantetheinyl transferase superfamily protein [Bacillota bacterium]